jgi:hypothetical protein
VPYQPALPPYFPSQSRGAAPGGPVQAAAQGRQASPGVDQHCPLQRLLLPFDDRTRRRSSWSAVVARHLGRLTSLLQGLPIQLHTPVEHRHQPRPSTRPRPFTLPRISRYCVGLCLSLLPLVSSRRWPPPAARVSCSCSSSPSRSLVRCLAELRVESHRLGHVSPPLPIWKGRGSFLRELLLASSRLPSDDIRPLVSDPRHLLPPNPSRSRHRRRRRRCPSLSRLASPCPLSTSRSQTTCRPRNISLLLRGESPLGGEVGAPLMRRTRGTETLTYDTTAAC